MDVGVTILTIFLDYPFRDVVSGWWQNKHPQDRGSMMSIPIPGMTMINKWLSKTTSIEIPGITFDYHYSSYIIIIPGITSIPVALTSVSPVDKKIQGRPVGLPWCTNTTTLKNPLDQPVGKGPLRSSNQPIAQYDLPKCQTKKSQSGTFLELNLTINCFYLLDFFLGVAKLYKHYKQYTNQYIMRLLIFGFKYVHSRQIFPGDNILVTPDLVNEHDIA